MKSSELLRIKTTKMERPDEPDSGRIHRENIELERGESSVNHQGNSPWAK
jgi:hypothetical protein